jgi:DNA polymerase
VSVNYHAEGQHPTSPAAYWAADQSGPTLLPAGHRIPAGLTYSTVRPDLDFESYSEAGKAINLQTGKVTGKGLPAVGTPVYAEHASTEVLCFSYDLKDGRGKRRWVSGMPDPQDLLDHIVRGGDIAAHNATFEFWIWNMICVRRFGWPPLQLEQLYCDMAKARRYSLPAALGKLAIVLGTAEKDKRGSQLIRLLCMPTSTTKNKQYIKRTPATDWDLFVELYGYCDQDIHTEACAAAMVPDLSQYERTAWLNDQRINARGVQVDIESLDACLRVLGDAERMYNAELCQVTGGAVEAATQTDKLKAWCEANGLPMENIQAEYVESRLSLFDKLEKAMLDQDFMRTLHPVDQQDAHRFAAMGHVRRALQIRAILGGANVKKLYTFKRMVSSDGRLRDQYVYCGADRTGRASAGGVQLQNITAKGPKTAMCESCELPFGALANPKACPRCNGEDMWHKLPEWTVEQVEVALADIRRYAGGLQQLVRIWGDPAAVLAGCLRGLLTARDQHELICCDFSAVEAVVLACLSRCQWRIDIFNSHAKIYEQSASNATGIPFEEILQYKIDNKMHHPARKGVGKIRELAGGFGGWIGAWRNFGADDYFANEEEIKQDVLKWRAESPEIVEFWGGQHRQIGEKPWDSRPELFGLEGAAVAAIQNPGKCYSYIDITYGVHNDVLFCRLPSGRYLHYHKPRLTAGVDHFRRPCQKITFEGWNSNSTKGPIGWHRMETYGGRLAENVTQAVAADIQFEAIDRLERNQYPVVMHTHDEASAEKPLGLGSVEHMVAIMAERPSWASWWPLRAAGWRHKRYQKD